MNRRRLAVVISVMLICTLLAGCASTKPTPPPSDGWKTAYDSKAWKIKEAIKMVDEFIEVAERKGIDGQGMDMDSNAKELISSLKKMARDARNINPKVPESASKDKAYQYQNLNDLANNACDLIESAIDNVAVGNLSTARSASDHAKATLRDIDYMYDTIVQKMN